MSLHDYKIGLKIWGDYPFYALIQACMRLADTDNLDKLKAAFPRIYNELRARQNVPGGVLAEDEEKELHTRIISTPAPKHEYYREENW